MTSKPDDDLPCYQLIHYRNPVTRKDLHETGQLAKPVTICQYQPCPNRFHKAATRPKPPYEVPKKGDITSIGPGEVYPKVSPTSPTTRLPQPRTASGSKEKAPARALTPAIAPISTASGAPAQPPSPSSSLSETPPSADPMATQTMSVSQGPMPSHARAFRAAVDPPARGESPEDDRDKEPGGGGPGDGEPGDGGPGGEEPGGGGPGGGGPGGGGPGGGGPGGGGPGGGLPAPQGGGLGQAARGYKSKIKEPDIFLGVRHKTSEFLADLYLLFCSRPADYPNDESRIVTALSYLRGDARWWAEAKVEIAQQRHQDGRLVGFGTWDGFKRDFLVVFGETDPAQTATVQLGSLRYDTKEPLDRFNAKILRLFVKGGIREDSAQVAWYHSKLPGFLRDKIALMVPQPTNMEEWMEAAMQLNKAYLLNKEVDRAQGRITQRFKQRPDTSNPSIRAVSTGKLDNKTRQMLMKENKCFYCREVGHRVVNCPAKKNGPKTRAVEEEDVDEEPAEEDLGINAIQEDYNSDF